MVTPPVTKCDQARWRLDACRLLNLLAQVGVTGMLDTLNTETPAALTGGVARTERLSGEPSGALADVVSLICNVWLDKAS
jgi:hypothetical protein